MARAEKHHKTKSAKRTSRRKKNPKAVPPNCQIIDDVFFQRWRGLFGGERGLQHLEDLLRSRPSWHVSTSGKVTRADPFWLRTTLSEETDNNGVDRLAVDYRPYVHEPDYSRYKKGRFLLRTIDIIEWEDRLTSGNNVKSDYSPIAKFEEEEGLRPPRLAPTMPPPAPPSKKLPSTSAPKKKRRKAKQITPMLSTAAAPAVSEVATQDVFREAQGVDGADGRPTTSNPSTVTTVRKPRQSIKEKRVLEVLRDLDNECRVRDNMQPAEVEKIVKPRYGDASRRTMYRAYQIFLKAPPAK